MKYTNDDKEVVKAFMRCEPLKSYRCKSDGQSFFSGDLRVAEHYPHGDGTASTLVYDFTDRGEFFIDKQVQWHVIQLKRSVPRQNIIRVREAQKAGLVDVTIQRGVYEDTTSAT
jgi:hypothetical protein